MKRPAARFLAFTSVLPVLSVVACGSVSSKTDQPSTLATIGGSLTNAKGVTISDPGALRVALVWESNYPYAYDKNGQPVQDNDIPNGAWGKLLRFAQDVAVKPEFPAHFELDITAPPPETQAFWELFPAPRSVALRGELARIIVYEDVNHNGKLDLVDRDATAYVDRVVGAAKDYLLYLEGTMPSSPADMVFVKDADGKLPGLGFTLGILTPCADGTLPPIMHATCPPDYKLIHLRWAPVSFPIAIDLAQSPQLDRLMCQETGGDGNNKTGVFNNHPAGEYPATFPAPGGDGHLSCMPGGRSYQFQTCETNVPPAVCATTMIKCATDEYTLADGAAPPNGWPCTVAP